MNLFIYFYIITKDLIIIFLIYNFNIYIKNETDFILLLLLLLLLFLFNLFIINKNFIKKLLNIIIYLFNIK